MNWQRQILKNYVTASANYAEIEIQYLLVQVLHQDREPVEQFAGLRSEVREKGSVSATFLELFKVFSVECRQTDENRMAKVQRIWCNEKVRGNVAHEQRWLRWSERCSLCTPTISVKCKVHIDALSVEKCI